MIFYIKDKKTFKTKHIEPTEEYSLLVGSITDDKSTISIRKNNDIHDGDYIFNLNGWMGLIHKVDNQNNVCTISAKQIDYIFDRDVIDDGIRPTTSIEAYLQAELNKWFVNISDTHYQYPFINITVGSNTNEESAPAVDNKRCVNYRTYLEQLKRLYGIRCEFSVNGDTLNCNIVARKNTKNLILDYFPYEITGEDISETKVARITAINGETTREDKDGNMPALEYTDYFLLDNGEVSTDINASNRIDGDWNYITYSKNDVPLEKVKDEFEKNKYSHKITFLSSAKYAVYDFYDYLKISLNGKIYDSYIAKKTINSNGTYEYQAGDLAVTLTDKLQDRR